ncbi:unnamed protein product, partial [Adineta ricciae]
MWMIPLGFTIINATRNWPRFMLVHVTQSNIYDILSAYTQVIMARSVPA